MKVYLNGNILNKESVGELMEPGFLYGWGAFETIRVYNGNVVGLEAHVDRLKNSLKLLQLPMPVVDFDLVAKTIVEENSLNEAFVRFNIYKKKDGVGVLACGEECDFYPPELYLNGASMMWAPFVRHSTDPFVHIKSMSYGFNRTAWWMAKEKKYDESVFVNEHGHVLEGSRSNIYFVKNDTVYTPALSCGVLGGITRLIVKEICKRFGVDFVEGEFSREDFLDADEVFMTSSLMDVLPVSRIEDVVLDNKKFNISKKLLKEYRNHCAEYRRNN